MNRLQKKCFVASAGLHLLLGLILVIGPAFVVSQSKPDNIPVLDFVPLKTVDALDVGRRGPQGQAAALADGEAPAAAASPRRHSPASTPPVEVKQPDQPKEIGQGADAVRKTPRLLLRAGAKIARRSRPLSSQRSRARRAIPRRKQKAVPRQRRANRSANTAARPRQAGTAASDAAIRQCSGQPGGRPRPAAPKSS